MCVHTCLPFFFFSVLLLFLPSILLFSSFTYFSLSLSHYPAFPPSFCSSFLPSSSSYLVVLEEVHRNNVYSEGELYDIFVRQEVSDIFVTIRCIVSILSHQL